MTLEKFEHFYLVEPHPTNKGCSIFEYKNEEFNEIYKNFEIRSNITKKVILGEIKRHLGGLSGECVFLPHIKTRDDFWSFQNSIDKRGFEGNIGKEFDVYKLKDHHVTKEKTGTVEIEIYDSFDKKDLKKILKFFRVNTFHEDDAFFVRFLKRVL